MSDYQPEDRTAKAIIRDTALRVFGERGPAAATLKVVADRAGVSQSLIIKHFASRDGLIAAVDEHVLGILSNSLRALAEADAELPPAGYLAGASALSDPDTARYLSYLLLEDSPRAATAYRRLHAHGTELMEKMRDAGAVADDIDHGRLTAMLVAHGLSTVLLRDRLTEVLGDDPMSASGQGAWWVLLDRLYSGDAIGSSVTRKEE
ncbi:AcrR family transcriptional regulator [Microbacterium ginsengiterrae]|uniref:AcrR family transcriptional regulator n=1 Tax=Microbacterium ginsengiterrae TaxID=546115 RepID=A0A7W9CCM1_9MICO|nr:TetR/AcrR family transcriptional regulator [Microbacterium ginsengiterrae]MBB5743119.1 AcrR family transcriptional regulator [Microbacterium ginsengiterrae]